MFLRLATEDSDLRTALLLEEAAICMLQQKPALWRRSSFHYALAGHRHIKSGQKEHALRCYRQSAEAFRDKGWNFVDDHLNLTLGRQHIILGHVEEAFKSFSLLLRNPDQPALTHQIQYKEVCATFEKLVASGKVNQYSALDFPVPVLKQESIQVMLGIDEFPEELSSTIDDEVHYQQLEKQLLTELKANMRVSQRSRRIFNNYTANNIHPTTVVGEPVTVQFQLTNSLQIPLELKDVRLICKFEVSAEKQSSLLHRPKLKSIRSHGDIAFGLHESRADDVNISLNALNLSTKDPPLNDSSDTFDPLANSHPAIERLPSTTTSSMPGSPTKQRHSVSFNLESSHGDARVPEPIQDHPLAVPIAEFDSEMITEIPLGPCESKTVSLTVVPKLDGKLSILGVTFTLPGNIPAHINFRPKGKRLNGNIKERATVMYAPDYRLQPIVLPPMPLLRAQFSGVKPVMIAGETLQATLRLENVGQTMLTNLIVACNDPEMVIIGKYPSKSSKQPTDIKKGVFSLPSSDHSSSKFFTNVSQSADDEECVCKLEVADVLELPVWIRPDTARPTSVHFVFYYETRPKLPALPYRLSRLSLNFDVMPSISLGASSLPVPNSLTERFLEVSAENFHPSRSSVLSKLFCFSDKYEISAPLTLVVHATDVINPGQSLLLRLRMLDISQSSILIQAGTQPSPLFASAIAMKDPTISSLPLENSEFLLRDFNKYFTSATPHPAALILCVFDDCLSPSPLNSVVVACSLPAVPVHVQADISSPQYQLEHATEIAHDFRTSEFVDYQ